VLMRWVGDVSRMHHPVLWWNTTGWACHSLPVLAFLVSRDGIVSYDGLAEELGKGAASTNDKRSLSLVDKPLMILAFFFSSVSTCLGAYCAKWLNNLE
jgi:hypothetical protein